MLTQRAPATLRASGVTEHGDDAAALLEALRAAPAVVIGRSYGGTVATNVALRHTDRVRALVLLEPDASRELAPAAAEWVDRVVDRLRDAAAGDGVDAVAEALIGEAAGEDAWRAFPEERRTLAGNGPAILAELGANGGFRRTPPPSPRSSKQALVVMAADSPPEFHQAPEVLAEAIPSARLSRVGGGHLIDPASPESSASSRRRSKGGGAGIGSVRFSLAGTRTSALAVLLGKASRSCRAGLAPVVVETTKGTNCSPRA